MRIAMIGTGYVGLVSGACFADFGHHVTCIDKDPAKIAMIHGGKMPIWEPGLDALVKANADHGRLKFTTDLAEGIEGAEAVFIAVGTPSRRGDGHADLTFVFDAVRELARALTGPVVVVTKSTVPVGTGDKIAAILAEENAPAGTSVASNPEFLREGAAISDFKRPDRIVIGCEDARAEQVMRDIYRPLSLGQAPLMFTGRRTAELIKYAANAFLATKITFINEIADLCEAVGADVKDVSRGMGLDNRIGSKFLHAGPGYGGSCFPKDTLALLKTADDEGVPQRIVEATVAVNDSRKRAMAKKVIAAAGGSVRGFAFVVAIPSAHSGSSSDSIAAASLSSRIESTATRRRPASTSRSEATNATKPAGLWAPSRIVSGRSPTVSKRPGTSVEEAAAATAAASSGCSRNASAAAQASAKFVRWKVPAARRRSAAGGAAGATTSRAPRSWATAPSSAALPPGPAHRSSQRQSTIVPCQMLNMACRTRAAVGRVSCPGSVLIKRLP